MLCLTILFPQVKLKQEDFLPAGLLETQFSNLNFRFQEWFLEAITIIDMWYLFAEID